MPASRPDQPSGLSLDRSVDNDGTSTEVVGGVSMTTANLIWTAPTDNGCPITSKLYVCVCVLLQTKSPDERNIHVSLQPTLGTKCLYFSHKSTVWSS